MEESELLNSVLYCVVLLVLDHTIGKTDLCRNPWCIATSRWPNEHHGDEVFEARAGQPW